MAFFSLVRMAVFVSVGFLVSLPFSISYAAIAVLYPDIRDPYREVVTAIVAGIKQGATREINFHVIDDNYDRDALREVLLRQNTEVVIALGRGGFAAAQELKLNRPVVVGALIIAPEDVSSGISGISLAADPDLLFARLKAILPDIKKVSVVYNRAHSEWLVSLGQSAAKRHGVRLLAYPVEDSRGAAKVYRDILANSRQASDAIWLLPDATVVEDRVILPLILKGAWDNYLAVFSSNPAHVKRGALFSLFPDNKAMGVSLVKRAQRVLTETANGSASSIEPLSDLHAALNTRTADHLGLVISIEQQREFALIFPAP